MRPAVCLLAFNHILILCSKFWQRLEGFWVLGGQGAFAEVIEMIIQVVDSAEFRNVFEKLFFGSLLEGILEDGREIVYVGKRATPRRVFHVLDAIVSDVLFFSMMYTEA